MAGPQPQDRFLWRPTVIAIAILTLVVAPLVATPRGGFLSSPWEMIELLALLIAALAWAAALLAATIAKRWRYVGSLVCAALMIFLAASLLLQYRSEFMVIVARAEITATVTMRGHADGQPYITNRAVSDEDAENFALLVYDETDADLPQPGRREKNWIRYDWNVSGCKMTAEPLGGHFYLETADCSAAR